MYVQFSQGLPCLVVDEERQKIFFDTRQDIASALETFYERIIADDVDYFALGAEYAVGFHTLVDRLRDTPADGDGFIKGQVTGPVSLGLTITDETRRASLYNDLLADALTKTCAMKARWQIRQLKSLRSQVIIFIDEPYSKKTVSLYISEHWYTPVYRDAIGYRGILPPQFRGLGILILIFGIPVVVAVRETRAHRQLHHENKQNAENL
jgi:hypothetical protein